MSYLKAVLIAEARAAGRGVRTALVRHRRIVPKPLGMVLWQLGAEPFTVGALAWGFGPKDRTMVVPGEPRDRDLAFRALTEVAHAFNKWFEGGHGGAPQLILPNAGMLTLLGRLGRRLAWLPTDGDRPADPALVRFGRHVRFLADHSQFPGQQLVLVLTELLQTHWATELSDVESQNLAALDAAIEPPPGMTGHEAAAKAELQGIGPVPTDEDKALAPLVQEFNKVRARRTEEAVVGQLRRPIVAHYEGLVFRRGWPLLWKCLERERNLPEAPSVERRWVGDMEALGRHLDWMGKTGGRRRVRQTAAQAASTLQHWEDAQRLLLAEEVIDDGLRLLPELLANRALMGRVVQVDLDHKERAAKSVVARPLVTIEVPDRCMVPDGKELYWTGSPKAKQYTVVGVEKIPKTDKWRVTLRHETSAAMARPARGDDAIFTVHHLHNAPPALLPRQVPWTHAAKTAEDRSIEEPGDSRSWE